MAKILPFRTRNQQRRIIVIGNRAKETVRVDVLPPMSHANFRADFATLPEAFEAAARLSGETGWRVFDATRRGPLDRRAGQ